MDNRRLILLVVFFLSLFMLWEAWQKYNQPKVDALVAVSSAAPPELLGGQAAVASQPIAAPSTAPALKKGESVNIATDLFTAELSTLGGDIVGLTLNRYNDRTDKNKRFMLLGDEHKYRAQNGLTIAGQKLPDHNTVFTLAPGKRSLGDDEKTLQVRLDAATANGINVSKVYTFTRGSYLINVHYEVDNGTQQSLAPTAYFQLRRDGVSPAGESRMVSTFTGSSVYTAEEKYQKIAFSDIDKDKAVFVKEANDGWVAMVQHYFVSAWIPAPQQKRNFYMRKIGNGDSALYDAGVMTPMAPIAPGEKGELSMSLYTGPQLQSVLDQFAKPITEGGLGAEGLSRVVDYGWLTIVAAPIFWCLEAIHKLVGNWGWSIVLLTICIKLLFFPLSAASYKSMARMRALTPRLTVLRERCGDDKQKLNMEMMALYKTEKVNPLGGCLPILVQIPVFIALYWALLGAVEMRDAPWVMWIHDLSSQDPLYILPVIMVATMLIQTKLNPTPPDPIQAKVAMFMPFIFGGMFFFFPSGLVLYWVVNNTLSIAQQWQITRMIERGTKAANDATI